MKITLKMANFLVGLPSDFKVNSPLRQQEALALCKQALIKARLDNNEDQAKKLSQVKELYKRLGRRWCACGSMKSTSAMRCPVCARLVKGKGKLDGPIGQRPGRVYRRHNSAILCACRRPKTNTARWCPVCRKANGHGPTNRGKGRALAS